MKLLLVGQGYIGSYLTEGLVRTGHDLTVCSVSFGLPKSRKVHYIQSRYEDLQAEFIGSFDRILWFAGHSSVSAAVNDPSGAVRNNCFDLLEFARRKPKHIPLIYASTASLYSVRYDGESNEAPPPAMEDEAKISSMNAYDSSKAAFDALVGPLSENTCGLRLGTVCGFSPKLRKELVFNAMNLSARHEGHVKVSNCNAWRSLLFLDDLTRVVDALLYTDSPMPRFLNVASCEISIGDLANQIADFHGVDVKILPDTQTYSFRMATDEMLRIVGQMPYRTIAERCADFWRDFSETKMAKNDQSYI